MTIGNLFPMTEGSAIELLGDLTSATVAVNDPPWSALAAQVRTLNRVVDAWNMELSHLDALAEGEGDSEVVVGIGGGTALDTAKYLAWKTGKRLIQVPSILSVDAGFTNAVGIRDQGRVRYVGEIEPEFVLLDLPLISSAPARLNRAGIGDILSCHTGLFDWQVAAAAGQGVPWDVELAELGRSLLTELADAADDIGAVSESGLRFIANSFRKIGAACAAAGHSRFEEGTEHFWAYCYEHATGAHQVHGELISLGVAAMSYLQENDPEWVLDVISRSQIGAHPSQLEITEDQFCEALVSLRQYRRAESLDYCVVDELEVTPELAAAAWRHVDQLVVSA